MAKFDNSMILYRPVGLQELELIYDSGMRAFPARLPEQPIFYPVLDLVYARQIASDWNAKNGKFAGYLTELKVQEEYISQFEKHTIGRSRFQELWIPAEDMEEFNKHIIGHIKVVEAHFGDGFQGFIPEKFDLEGKNAVAQFTLLTNSYIYKRMDFYLEIKRNHKAVFLNYPFWQKHEFENPKLKEKILQAIKEAWFTSFPKIPLPLPLSVDDDAPLAKQTDAAVDEEHLVDPVEEEIAPVEQTESYSLVNSAQEDLPFVKPTDTPAHSQHLVDPVQEEIARVEQADSYSLTKPVQEGNLPLKQTESHFVQGIKLGLSGKYGEASDELSKAIAEDPHNVAAHVSLGVAFRRLSEDDRALSCYETALKINSKYAEAHYFRANILYEHGNAREAIAGYTIAMGLEPELIEAHQNPGPTDRLSDFIASPAQMYRIAKPAHRILDLNKLLESNPGQAELFKERAAEYYRLWNYEQAIADCNSSLTLRPDDATALHFRGRAYEQIGESERAQDDYRRAIAINSQLSDAYINRGVTFGKMGHFRQSMASLSEGIRLSPKNPDGYFNRGMTYFQQGDLESAIADFSMVIQLSSNDEDAYYWRGICNEATGRRQDAVADYRQFLRLSRDPHAREEVTQKLSRWQVNKRDRASRRRAGSQDKQETTQVQLEQPVRDLDLHGLIVALGERALHSTWFGSGVDCYGEKAEELYALTARNRPIQGRDLLRITSGIHQTMKGDFQAFDPGATYHWAFIRAWEGSGFYFETNDPETKERVKAHFQAVEEVESANPPYEGLFIRI